MCVCTETFLFYVQILRLSTLALVFSINYFPFLLLLFFLPSNNEHRSHWEKEKEECIIRSIGKLEAFHHSNAIQIKNEHEEMKIFLQNETIISIREIVYLSL